MSAQEPPPRGAVPPLEPDPAFLCPDKTLADLEWARLLAALGDRASSPLGREAALALPFLGAEGAATSLAEVAEATEALLRGEPLPIAAVEGAREEVARAELGAVLSTEELARVRDLARGAARLRDFLDGHRETAPRLSAACEVPAEARVVAERLERAIDPDGTLSDAASPRLKELRAERAAVRGRLVRKLEEMVSASAGALAGGYWTERDGRYVLPVRSDSLGKVSGIVHGASGSGATLFVEPSGAIDLGNRLKLAEAEAAREEHRILGALSREVGAAAGALRACEAALVRADLRGAAGRLAVELGLSSPEIAAWDGEPSVDLPRARHPLLLLQGTDVVASRVVLRPGRALVVSGPNAGGKTVSLKTAGLAALMLRAGLPVPASSGARVALFDAVLTDVGDDQSVAQNLSTFSAHVRNLAGMLERAGPRALILCDELASGTDPREGEALATAILEELTARGGTVAVTTHYEGLKALAARDTRTDSASVGFDLARMQPTFSLTLGVPGVSAALAVAERYGVPAHVVTRARGHLDAGVRTFTEVVQRLEAERAALGREREELAQAREAHADAERALAARAEALEARDRAKLRDETQRLLSEVRKARVDLRTAEERLARSDRAGVDEAKALVDAVSRQALPGGGLEAEVRVTLGDEPRGAPTALRVGATVYVPKLRAEAKILEVLPDGRLRVAAGAMKLTLGEEELRAPAKREPAPAPRKARPKPSVHTQADLDGAVQTSTNTCDLRGLRAHEATELAERFFDKVYGDGDRVAFLIHGFGTGSLREAIRGLVRSSRYVRQHRPGEPGEGGDGVTVVLLRD